MRHALRWTAPAPLWSRFAATGGTPDDEQFRPAILRFESDDFMEQLLAVLERDPSAIAGFLARPETWRSAASPGADLIERTAVPRQARALERLLAARAPKASVPPVAQSIRRREQGRERDIALKLYQPAHQRYYLVAADLVCATAGFPQRALATGGREQVGFVVRRLLASGTAGAAAEHAFVKDAAGATWKPAPDDALADGEELLPVFPMAFRDDQGHPRRLLAGMVPVGRVEEYLGTGPAAPAADGNGTRAANTSEAAARKEQFRMDVAEPWKNVLRAADRARESVHVNDGLGDASDGEVAATRRTQARAANLQLQMQSWLVLLDFADYLADHVPAVWRAIDAPANPFASSSAPGKLWQWLDDAKMDDDLAALLPARTVAASLRDALRRAALARAAIEAVDTILTPANAADSRWPPFLFLLAGIAEDTDFGQRDTRRFPMRGVHASIPSATPDLEGETPDVTATLVPLSGALAAIDKAVALVIRAIDPAQAAAPAPLPFAAKLARAVAATGNDPGRFVIRCVHEQRDCGPLARRTVSLPTREFRLARFFDPDAPARPVRIALPLDTTPAGLRKFNRNTALIVSDVLCGQMARAKGLGLIDLIRHVLPWPLHKDLEIGDLGPCRSNGEAIGMICSLSIPIVTLCALILLMIIVSLLDFVFRWLPWLILCFPVKGLKGKP